MNKAKIKKIAKGLDTLDARSDSKILITIIKEDLASLCDAIIEENNVQNKAILEDVLEIIKEEYEHGKGYLINSIKSLT